MPQVEYPTCTYCGDWTQVHQCGTCHKFFCWDCTPRPQPFTGCVHIAYTGPVKKGW